MNLKIAMSNGQLDEGLRQYVVQRLRDGLLRFKPRIASATVSFLDLSGPYGAEQQCFLALGLTPTGKISVKRRGASVRLALARAVETSIRELRRRFEPTEKSDRRVT